MVKWLYICLDRKPSASHLYLPSWSSQWCCDLIVLLMMLYSANSLSLLDFRYSVRCLNSCGFHFYKLESWIKTMLHVIYICISVTCSLENSWAPHILQTHDHRLWTTDVMWYKKLIRPFVRWTKKFYCKPFYGIIYQ